MSDLEHLLELQALDLAIDQGRRRLEHLPEHQASAAAAESVLAGQAEVRRLEQELFASETAMEAVETASTDIDRKVDRLQGQLRTVFAVREAEALQHQIATLHEDRSQLDDQGLAELERGEQLANDLDAARRQLPELEAAAAQAAVVASEAAAVVTAELDDLRARRGEQAAMLPASLLDRYEAMRRTHGGVAVARLSGSRCEGCHLDLSRTEVEALRHVPAGEPGECPSCGRLVVVQG